MDIPRCTCMSGKSPLPACQAQAVRELQDVAGLRRRLPHSRQMHCKRVRTGMSPQALLGGRWWGSEGSREHTTFADLGPDALERHFNWLSVAPAADLVMTMEVCRLDPHPGRVLAASGRTPVAAVAVQVREERPPAGANQVPEAVYQQHIHRQPWDEPAICAVAHPDLDVDVLRLRLSPHELTALQVI